MHVCLLYSGHQICSGNRHGAVRGSRGSLRLAGRHGSVVPTVQEQRPRSQHVQHGQLGYVSLKYYAYYCYYRYWIVTIITIIIKIIIIDKIRRVGTLPIMYRVRERVGP